MWKPDRRFKSVDVYTGRQCTIWNCEIAVGLENMAFLLLSSLILLRAKVPSVEEMEVNTSQTTGIFEIFLAIFTFRKYLKLSCRRIHGPATFQTVVRFPEMVFDFSSLLALQVIIWRSRVSERCALVAARATTHVLFAINCHFLWCNAACPVTLQM